ncbi:PilZ domain-containing protein [bacterium]|nr:PilZ domain-containing protein [bacterium]
MEKENRVLQRTPISFKISLSESSGGEDIKLDATNLGADGIFVSSPLLWKPGQTFNLRFTLPGFDKEMKIKGIVARSDDKYSIFTENDSSVSGMWIKFTNLSGEERRLITEFIEKTDSK